MIRTSLFQTCEKNYICHASGSNKTNILQVLLAKSALTILRVPLFNFSIKFGQ